MKSITMYMRLSGGTAIVVSVSRTSMPAGMCFQAV
ncbi:Hypothetical protein RG1141_CH14380 [Neorhizobium galegae bv. officinalis bv. officinalis str. HAMBI 1141]|uniref:Uncharacterized protein n=1 Tax=Neorhizobium galegae bv. officinalis bv. officinalis str. HAMBI 1141 TaxID=1028801 RepID=A0A068T8S3_NEOGA|nr:Hypothetical protein RG1141_CH14380 [Neorhizobium galegae bv. officinalis bv. officinalis str. HAMBI 1141]